MISEVCRARLEGARVDLARLGPREEATQRVRLLDAFLAEWEVGQVAVEDTIGISDIAVANQVEAGRGRGFAHSWRCYGKSLRGGLRLCWTVPAKARLVRRSRMSSQYGVVARRVCADATNAQDQNMTPIIRHA